MHVVEFMTKPAIFLLAPYFISFPGLSSNVLTLVTIFLPLSSLWAAAAVTARSQPTPSQLASPSNMNRSGNFRQRLLRSFTPGNTGLLVGLQDTKAKLSLSATAVSQSSAQSHAHLSVLVNGLEK